MIIPSHGSFELLKTTLALSKTTGVSSDDDSRLNTSLKTHDGNDKSQSTQYAVCTLHRNLEKVAVNIPKPHIQQSA